MTVAELKKYYQNLLIMQYLGKEKAYATIGVLVNMAIMNKLPLDVQNGFNLDSAVGAQLDVLGKYIGISRQGYDFSGPVTLDDDSYRQVLKIKIIQNNLGSSLADIQDFMNTFFEGQIFVFDYLGMRIGYYLDTTVGSLQLAEFFIMQGLLPKPMGVQLSATIYGPDLDTFYGFRTYEHEAVNASPMNTYEDYNMNYPWLRYEDALVI